MPRVKIDYVVSFSSEDPEHPANNLLLREVSKKKWLCQKGETSCSVVLQLPRAVKITGVHIGAYHAALVQVLVGRSETSSEQFQVLVPSSVLMSREESKRAAPVTRVRSFGADALSSPARAQRWDRVRLVCSQPHNKHCQFGLSFVHIDEAEGEAPAPAPPAPGPPALALDTFDDDEDDFKPGELFAKHLQGSAEAPQSNMSADTGTQIRQATSQALKNINESSTKLLKTPISKPRAKRAHSPATERSDRARDTLLYDHDDTLPPSRQRECADKLNNTKQKARDDTKTKEDYKTRDGTKTKDGSKTKDDCKTKDDSKTQDKTKIKDESKTKDEPKKTPTNNRSVSPTRAQRHDKPRDSKGHDVKKRSRSGSQDDELVPGPRSSEPHTLLRGAELVLSGYVHPRRAHVRALALALGARVRPDWGPGATHLICAFPNTPKLRAVRSLCADTPAARAEWLEQVSRRRRLLPWRWFATEPDRLVRVTPQQLDQLDCCSDKDEGGDTDDEIEKVLQEQKKRRLNDSASSDTRSRPRSPLSDDGGPTDDEAPGPPRAAPARALPHFLAGLTFAVDAAPAAARELQRYVRAYGGDLVQMPELGEGCAVDYVVRGRGARGGAGGGAGGARVVGGAWLARCHEAQALVPH